MEHHHEYFRRRAVQERRWAEAASDRAARAAHQAMAFAYEDKLALMPIPGGGK